MDICIITGSAGLMGAEPVRFVGSKGFEIVGIDNDMRKKFYLSVDHTTHSLFGVSKLAADAMVQEYGRYFGMTTACFRGG